MSTLVKDNRNDEIKRFEKLFLLFEEAPNVFKYKNLLNTLIQNQGNDLIILFEDIVAFDPTLAKRLKDKSEILLEKANLAL